MNKKGLWLHLCGATFTDEGLSVGVVGLSTLSAIGGAGVMSTDSGVVADRSAQSGHVTDDVGRG